MDLSLLAPMVRSDLLILSIPPGYDRRRAVSFSTFDLSLSVGSPAIPEGVPEMSAAMHQTVPAVCSFTHRRIARECEHRTVEPLQSLQLPCRGRRSDPCVTLCGGTGRTALAGHGPFFS
jgi:hypothetical protein